MNATKEIAAPDAEAAARTRAALARAWAEVRAASEAERPAALRRLRDAAAAAGEADLARAVFAAERTGVVEPILGPPPASTTPEEAAPRDETPPAPGAEALRLKIVVAADRAPAARRKIVRRLLERSFEVVVWRETEEGAATEVRAAPAALAALLDGVPDIRWTIEDQTSRTTVAA